VPLRSRWRRRLAGFLTPHRHGDPRYGHFSPRCGTARAPVQQEDLAKYAVRAVCATLDTVRRYLADTSALIVYSTVAGVFVEIVVAGLTVEQCLRARLTAVPIILVTGRPYGLYRDWIWRLSRAEEGVVARRVIADTTAFVSFQLPVYWIVLIIAGATFWQIAAASVTATIILLVSGRPYGALLDAARLAPQAVPSYAASRRSRARLSACPGRATIVTGSAVTGQRPMRGRRKCAEQGCDRGSSRSRAGTGSVWCIEGSASRPSFRWVRPLNESRGEAFHEDQLIVRARPELFVLPPHVLAERDAATFETTA